MLTDRFIRNAKPGVFADEGGLYLRVYATGVRSFVFRDRSGGKDKWETIGQYPAMGLADARDALAKRKSGHTTKTVRQAWDDYYDHLRTQYVDPEQTERMFEKDIMPEFGTRSIESLTRADWAAQIKKVVDRGSTVMANRLLTQVRRFLDYSEQQGWIEENPLEKVKRKTMGGKETAKDRNLSLTEIWHFLCLLGSKTHRMSKGTRWTLYGCLLTGLRASEVLALTDDGKTFTKMQRQHSVPLTFHVKAWLKVRPENLPRDHRVMSQALRDLKQTFTPHDLRRTFASRLADLEVAPHVIEKMLDHQMVGVMAVYNRATYWKERTEAQHLWGEKIAELRRKKEAPVE